MTMFWIFVFISIIGIIGYGIQILSVRSHLHRKIQKVQNFLDCSIAPLKPGEGNSLPPISILKPLKGIDDNLFDNLASFCDQDYPEYEIIFSLQDHNDPAYKVAKKIKDRYPERDISIIVERNNTGLNPKINNLIPAYRASKYEYVLISDSNVMVDKDYLKEIIKHMEDPDVGLVSNIIKGVGGNSIGSIFENLHLNSFIIGSVCLLDRLLKMPCVIGKSMLIRKADFEAIGGFNAVKDVLAEDYVIGERIHKMGKRVVLSNYAIKNVNVYWSIKKFLNRHTRWGKLRWRLGGIKYFLELIGNPVFISCLPLFVDASRVTILFALSVSLIKVMGDLYLGKIIDSGSNPIVYILSPLKDILIGLIWFVPIMSNTVIWRGNRYIIGKDSLLSPYPETGIWSWRYKILDTIKARFA